MQIDSFFKYLVRYVLFVYVVCIIVTLIFSKHKLILAAGLSIGTALGILKLKAIVITLKELLPENGVKSSKISIIANLLCYLLIFALLIAVALYSGWLFAGTAAGLMIIPLVLTVYSIGKGLGFIRK